MKRPQNIMDPQLEGALANLQLMRAAGAANDPYQRFLASIGLCPVGGGRQAARFQAIQRRMLVGRAIANLIAGPRPPPLPSVDPKTAIRIGFVRSLKRWLLYPISGLRRHCLTSGPTGAGKTNGLWFWLTQLIDKGLRISFQDYKNEGRRLLNNYPDVAVLRIDQLRENLLDPVGDPKTYYTNFVYEFARAYGIRREARKTLLTILLRMDAGMKKGEHRFSLADLRKCVRVLAETGRDTKLWTLLEALESLEVSLGRNAFVRSGVRVEDRCRIVVREHQGLPPSFGEFHRAMDVDRMLARSVAEGHANETRMIYVSDEGSFEFGKEFASERGSGYVPPQIRLFTQTRSSGGCVLVGVQRLENTDESLLANTGAYACVGAQTSGEQRIAGPLLRLPEERWAELGRMKLGDAWWISHLHPSAIPIHIPECDMGRYLSDDEVAERMKDIRTWLDSNTVFAPPDDEVEVPISYLKLIGEKCDEEGAQSESFGVASILAEHKAMLEEILANEGASLSTAELYQRLGFSAGKGGRVKRDLLQNGLIRIERLSSGGRPREVLLVTDRGRGFVDEVR